MWGRRPCTLFCVSPSEIIHNCDREIPEGDLRQEAFRTFSGNKKPALERGAVEPFLLCGNGRICIGRKYPQVHRTSEQSVLILWRRGNAAVKENGVELTDDNEASKDQLLGWLDFWSPGNHDDRTIAILYEGEDAITEEKSEADEPNIENSVEDKNNE